MTLVKWLLLGGLVASAVLCPPASAFPTLVPTNFQAHDGLNGTVVLTWDAPLLSGNVTYNLYVGGNLTATLAGTNYTVPLGQPVLYTLTATQSGKSESAPTALLVGRIAIAPELPVRFNMQDVRIAGCPPLSTAIYTYYPYVGIATHTECLPVVRR